MASKMMENRLETKPSHNKTNEQTNKENIRRMKGRVV